MKHGGRMKRKSDEVGNREGKLERDITEGDEVYPTYLQLIDVFMVVTVPLWFTQVIMFGLS